MGNISQEYFEKYRYYIEGALGILYISEPIGWNEDDKVLKRSDTVHGVFSFLSNNLEFYKGDEHNEGGFNFLKETYDTYGINANVRLVKEENFSGVFEEIYRGYFDFSTYEQNEYTISVKFNESGLYEKIQSRNLEDLELDRLTTMDGMELEPLRTDVVALDGRKILIIDELKITTSDPQIEVPVESTVKVWLRPDKVELLLKYNSNQDYNAVAIPMTMVAEQSGNVQTIYGYEVITSDIGWDIYNGSTDMIFYYAKVNDNPIKMTIDIELEVVQTSPTQMRVELVKFKDGTDYNFKEVVSLIIENQPVIGQRYKFQASDYVVPLLMGESLALIVHCRETSNDDVSIFIHKSNITIEDETYYEASKADFVLPFEALDRIITVITNKKGALKSNALGRTDIGYKKDGEASLTGLTNGFWVRQFNTEKVTTSFQDFIESFKCVWQLGYGIEKIGFSEFVRVENIKHFYQDLVTIKLGGGVSNVSRKCAAVYHYSSIEIGYSQPSGTILYEEVLGLDEYNIKNNYTTPITRIDKKFNNVSKYRADSYGTEFARRKPKSVYPEEDTRYDLSVMILDLKRGIDKIFQQRKWADDFIEPVPFDRYTTGIYSPDTATNLRFSPINTMLRWGFWLKGGLMKNLTEYTRYTSSVGNSKLKTKSKEAGSKEYTEQGNVLNSDFNKNLFLGDIIEFEYPVDGALLKTLNGYIEVGGEKIMNYYGLVEFLNYQNELEYGYLLSVEPNGNGKWKLLSASRKPIGTYNPIDSNTPIVPPSNLTAVDNTPKP